MANKLKANKTAWFYVASIINKSTGHRIAYKIGETTNLYQRMLNERAYYKKAYHKDIEMRILFTKEYDSPAMAIAAESFVRMTLILDNPDSYRDTDRFVSRKNWDMTYIEKLVNHIK